MSLMVVCRVARVYICSHVPYQIFPELEFRSVLKNHELGIRAVKNGFIA